MGVRKPVLLYGLVGGVLIALLHAIEYRYLVVEHAVEIYGGLVALIFASLGIWLGLRLTQPKERVVVREVEVQVPVEVSVPVEFTLNEERLAAVGMTRREDRKSVV